jgi:hypothetical protein
MQFVQGATPWLPSVGGTMSNLGSTLGYSSPPGLFNTTWSGSFLGHPQPVMPVMAYSNVAPPDSHFGGTIVRDGYGIPVQYNNGSHWTPGPSFSAHNPSAYNPTLQSNDTAMTVELASLRNQSREDAATIQILQAKLARSIAEQ